ncbi:hypothetical protein [Cupriavidus basilensis]|nr:hypothetical protein [Cupriavidus basilensis]MDR3382237.1 hypothetical protein [Cupriavidus basilensis]
MVLVVPRKLPVDRTLPGTLGREDIKDGFGPGYAPGRRSGRW